MKTVLPAIISNRHDLIVPRRRIDNHYPLGPLLGRGGWVLHKCTYGNNVLLNVYRYSRAHIVNNYICLGKILQQLCNNTSPAHNILHGDMNKICR